MFKKLGYDKEEIVFNNLSKYRLSAIQTVEEFEKVYDQISKEFNLSASYIEFIKEYKSIFDKVDYYKEVSLYEKSLSSKCEIGILSNLTVFDKERLNMQVDLSKYDYVFLSFELGCRKPDDEIYDKVNEIIGSNKDILFVDDKEINLEAARKHGWKTLLATGLELDKIKEGCENFLNN